MDCLIILMHEVQDVEDFDAETFLVIVPEGLECMEELWVVRITNLVVWEPRSVWPYKS